MTGAVAAWLCCWLVTTDTICASCARSVRCAASNSAGVRVSGAGPSVGCCEAFSQRVNSRQPSHRDSSQGDALDAYIRCLERQSLEGSSQAGLARIRYEASAELAVTQSDDEICILARIPV